MQSGKPIHSEAKPTRMGEIEEASLQQPLLAGEQSIAISVEPEVARWSEERRPPGLLVTGEDVSGTPLGSPQSFGRFQQGGWLLAAVASSLLYAGFMFAAIVCSAYQKSPMFAPWLFIGAATSAIASSGLVFTAALKLHQRRLEHHHVNAHRYRCKRPSHRHKPSVNGRSPQPESVQSSPRPGPSQQGSTPQLGSTYHLGSTAPTNPNPNPGPNPTPNLPHTRTSTKSNLFRALPHLQVHGSGASTPQGVETPGNSTPSHEWNLAIGVDPRHENPVSLPMVLCATCFLTASAFTNLAAFTLAETSAEASGSAMWLAQAGLLLFIFSLGLIVSAVVRRGCSPDGTYAALWLVVDAPSHFAASRRGTSNWPSPRTPKTPKTPHVARTPEMSSIVGSVAATPGAQKKATQPIRPDLILPTPSPSPRQVERAVARILRGTVKTNIMVSLGGLYLNLPLALIPIVVSIFLTGPQRLVDSDQGALVYGLLFPLLFLMSALDFATFFFFLPRSVSAIWLALKHPRIASSHVRSGKGAMLLSSVVLFLPFVEFYFCVACVTVYLSAEGGSIGFGHLLITPWQCLGISSAGVVVVLLTSLVCIVSLKVRLSQLMEPHKLSSRTTKGIVYASLLVFVVVGVVTSVFQSLLARSLCLVALVAFVPFVRSCRRTESVRV